MRKMLVEPENDLFSSYLEAAIKLELPFLISRRYYRPIVWPEEYGAKIKYCVKNVKGIWKKLSYLPLS